MTDNRNGEKSMTGKAEQRPVISRRKLTHYKASEHVL
jgi:hypothetical protein